MATLAELRNIRLEKLERLKQLGVDAYPAKSAKKVLNKRFVDGFEKSEESGLFLVGVDVIAINDGGYASDDVPVFFREETGGLGVMEEGVLLAKDELHVADERRHPVRIPFIHRPGKADELRHAFFVGNDLDMHR